MKKTLIALAAIAAVSAASADVVITGVYDRGYSMLTSNNAQAAINTVASNSDTTRIIFIGTENLGGGLTAGFLSESDVQDNGGATQASTVAGLQNGTINNGQSYVNIGGADLGMLKLGNVNSFMHNGYGIASPQGFNTGYGSSWSSKFSIFNGISTGNTALTGPAYSATSANQTAVVAGARDVRIANTINYTAPAFSGVTLGAAFTPQNNNATNGVGNTVGVTEFNATYNSPKLTAMADSIKYVVGSNGTSMTIITQNDITANAAQALTQKTLTANYTNTHNLLAANYMALPTLKLHVGFGSSSSSDSTAKTSSNQYGITYTMGQFDIFGQLAVVNDQNATAAQQQNRKLQSVGVDYNLSKTVNLYARYENINYATNVAAFQGSTMGSTMTREAVGVRVRF